MDHEEDDWKSLEELQARRDAKAEKVEELCERLAKLEEERALWREELREVRARLEHIDKVLLLYGIGTSPWRASQ